MYVYVLWTSTGTGKIPLCTAHEYAIYKYVASWILIPRVRYNAVVLFHGDRLNIKIYNIIILVFSIPWYICKLPILLYYRISPIQRFTITRVFSSSRPYVERAYPDSTLYYGQIRVNIKNAVSKTQESRSLSLILYNALAWMKILSYNINGQKQTILFLFNNGVTIIYEHILTIF